MKRRITMITVLALAVAMGVLPVRLVTANPDATAGLRIGPGSTLWLKGNSNIHEFEARTSTVTVRVETADSTRPAPATAAELEALIKAAGVRAVDVDVPVTSLRSGKGGLDKNMWQDLRAAEFPAIRFHLTRYTLDPAAHGDTLVVRADGTLRIAGRERPATLTLRGTRGEAGLWLEGTYALRMTEYGIKPRTMMMGTMRVRDDVTVGYRLLLTGTR